ncbi:hypothetical protein F4679DRAFT_586834 [Xylaria curta]|nr:hypothetical protein F4679DRAFT_586834 [Xylaria curta]
MFVVQSVRTGDIFVNKVLEPGKLADGDPLPEEEVPHDLRLSTAPGVEGPLIGPLQVRGKMRTYFSEVALWQKIGHNAYSIYFKFYNGRSLSYLHEAYYNELRPVPESFIWHLLLTLIEAVRYLQRGVIPGTDDEPEGWRPIYNRDIAMNNIFIHYPERPDSEPTPRMGFEENAFPELVVGDFGQGNMEGDDEIYGGRWNAYDLEEWHDTYPIFSIVKDLCLTHIHYDYHQGDTPEGIHCSEINGFMTPEHVPYSEDLLNVLRLWEYPNCKNSLIDMTQSNGDEVVPNFHLVPDLDEIVRDILPIARSHVRRFRTPGGDVRPDYYRSINVSWTKSRRLMPYRWIRLNTDPYDDDDEDEDENNDDQNDDSQTNSGDQSNSKNDSDMQSGDNQNDGSGGAGGSGITDHQSVQDSSIDKNDESSAIVPDGNQKENSNQNGDAMNVDQNNGNNDEGGQDRDNGVEGSGDEDDGDPEYDEDEGSTDIIPHKCPEPNPVTISSIFKLLWFRLRRHPVGKGKEKGEGKGEGGEGTRTWKSCSGSKPSNSKTPGA